MEIKALFIAPSLSQAKYWAEYWGFQPSEWRRIEIIMDVVGLDFDRISAEVYIAGDSETIMYGTQQLVGYLSKHTSARLVDAMADTEETRPGWFQRLGLT